MNDNQKEKLTIYEVGPRDGLQNEPVPIGTSEKRQLIRGLIRAGLKRIELTSFVSPRLVPQMADSRHVVHRTLARSGERDDIKFTSLVLNERGYDYAYEAGSRGMATLVMTSDTLSLRNSGMTVATSLDLVKTLLQRAKNDGVWMRVYIGTAWVCPYEGKIDPDKTVNIAEKVWDMGVDELSIADTIGHAHPFEVGNLMRRLVTLFGRRKLAVHLHDTQALGLVNAAAALHAGVRIFDASVGGLGGCPFAPGAAGNLATEDLVFMAHKMGFDTGVKLAELWNVVQLTKGLVDRPIGGRIWPWWEANAHPATMMPGLT